MSSDHHNATPMEPATESGAAPTAPAAVGDTAQLLHTTVTVGYPNAGDLAIDRCQAHCGVCAPWVRRFLVREWAALILLGIVTAIVNTVPKPTCLPFQIGDPTISHAYHQDTFPVYSLAIMCILPVLVYLPLVYFLPRLPIIPDGPNRFLVEGNMVILMQATSVILSLIIAESTKTYAGRLRPDFLSRVAMEKTSCPNVTKLSLAEDCCYSNPIITDGRKSFPSGHCVTAFAAIVPLCLVLANRMRPLSRGSLGLLIVAWTPIILPFIVAVSRTIDYRHNFSDILGGSLIGIATAFIAVRLLSGQYASYS